jgi:pimeloyl-ACP methyl ester carboxylesterase
MRMVRMVAILAFLLAGCTEAVERSASTSAADRLGGKLELCQWPGAQGDVWCGTLEVPEDRSVEGGRAVGLRVAVLPATGDSVATDAVAFLAGGGVAPATRYLPFFAMAVARLRTERDIVLVDQRGTGASNPLDCELPEPHEVEGVLDAGPEYEEAYLQALSDCRETVGARADPTVYTTWNAADDLDDVREWLGYDRLSLWGASYGTKLARVYMRRHPGRVRAAVLHGVVPIEWSMWPDLFRGADSAFTELAALCAADPICADAYRNPEGRLADLARRLEDRPVRLRVPLAGSPADSVEVTFDRRSLAGLVIGMLRSSRASRSLPAVLAELADGDYKRIASMQRPGAPAPIPRGVYLSIACTEEVSRLTDADLERARQPTRLGAGEWFDEELRECEVWGRGTPPPGFWDPVESDVPVLLLTGSEDYITPPHYAERVAAGLPNASVRVVPQRGHDDVDPCVAALIENFLIQGWDTDPDLACPEDREPLPFEVPGG